MTDDVITATARTRFRRVSWDDVRPGDVVYYLPPFADSGERAYGPMTVGDAARRVLVNGGGVSVPGLSVQLLARLPDEPVTPH